ncbi:MAG: CDP-diacylglycerol--glycerol-3-phosphate 3-phosphatidyltransferase, partial [Lachnospiraceae bacterium]|nr:CDP-diacylglycerol--glycerol-3-phosphate 3-phosphatidyltransferase [Lachnospiraceae bacterium]
ERGVVIAASYWGKFKTTFQMFMTIALILHLQASGWQILEQALIWISTILTIVSLIDYLVKNRGVLKDEGESQ